MQAWILAGSCRPCWLQVTAEDCRTMSHLKSTSHQMARHHLTLPYSSCTISWFCRSTFNNTACRTSHFQENPASIGVVSSYQLQFATSQILTECLRIKTDINSIPNHPITKTHHTILVNWSDYNTSITELLWQISGGNVQYGTLFDNDILLCSVIMCVLQGLTLALAQWPGE